MVRVQNYECEMRGHTLTHLAEILPSQTNGQNIKFYYFSLQTVIITPKKKNVYKYINNVIRKIKNV